MDWEGIWESPWRGHLAKTIISSGKVVGFRPPPVPPPPHKASQPQATFASDPCRVPGGGSLGPPRPDEVPPNIIPSVPAAPSAKEPDATRRTRVTGETPTARMLHFEDSEEPPGGLDPSTHDPASSDPLNVVLTGMAQLQGVVADLAGSPKQSRQEVIRPGVSSLPDLPSAGPESCLQFADWLHASKPALSDISDTSEELWGLVQKEAKEWYTRYLRLDAVSRLTSKPIPSAEITQPKWARVSRRIETMIIAACPTTVRDEISAARVTGLLPVVARLYVIYAPGGLTERELGLRQIQDPSPGTNMKDTVDQLRRWHRWCDRMRELGGTLPDSALRVKALEKITRVVLQSNPDVAFRINLTRAALQVDSSPDDGKVEQLHAQMLGELEAVVHRAGSKDQDKNKDQGQTLGPKIKGIEDPSSSPKTPKQGKANPKVPTNPKSGSAQEGTTSAGSPCLFYSTPGGCKKGADCTFVHNWNAIPAAERAQRCRACGGKGHRAAECKAGLKGEEKAKYKAPPANPKHTGNPKGAQPGAVATAAVVPPPKEMSQQQIKSMLADAAQILQQASPGSQGQNLGVPQAMPISPAPSPTSQGPSSNHPVTQGTPVTIESLTAQRITGELLWLSQRTRIDIAFGVGLMSSWAVKSPSYVTKIGLRILAYLAKTKSLRLSLVPGDHQDLDVFTDASFAPYSEKSISGVVVQLSGKCVFWKSRRQTMVSLSTAECELIAACEGVVLGQSVLALAAELINPATQFTLRVDNVAAITLAEGGGSHRTRHLRVRANFLKEMLDTAQLRVVHCPGESQLADALTKALPTARLEYLNDLLGIREAVGGDPTVQAVMATSRTFRNVDPNEGQSMVLVMALLMLQLQPAASQEEDEAEPVDLDLYVVAIMMACSVLFVWELGKHCLRQCVRQSVPRIATVQAPDEEPRRTRRQDAIRRALERETEGTLRFRNTRDEATTSDVAPPKTPSPATLPSSHVHVHVSTPPTSEFRAEPPASSSSTLPWTLTRPPTPPIPSPPPYPPEGRTGVQGVRGRETEQNSREIGVQTEGPPGLSDAQLCELEVITSSARTPGVLHIFPDCHVLRTVQSTHRRTFCRYCLTTLRQKGLR